METWTKACGLPLLFSFEPQPHGSIFVGARAHDEEVPLVRPRQLHGEEPGEADDQRSRQRVDVVLVLGEHPGGTGHGLPYHLPSERCPERSGEVGWGGVGGVGGVKGFG